MECLIFNGMKNHKFNRIKSMLNQHQAPIKKEPYKIAEDPDKHLQVFIKGKISANISTLRAPNVALVALFLRTDPFTLNLGFTVVLRRRICVVIPVMSLVKSVVVVDCVVRSVGCTVAVDKHSVLKNAFSLFIIKSTGRSLSLSVTRRLSLQCSENPSCLTKPSGHCH